MLFQSVRHNINSLTIYLYEFKLGNYHTIYEEVDMGVLLSFQGPDIAELTKTLGSEIG